jgi:peptidoglycan/xylan/chitin deacetylase (PgdA/CDA1 family)
LERHAELDETAERDRIALTVESLARTVGQRPVGWYCRYAPGPNTRRLVAEEGGFLYDSDAYNDELPYWVRVNDRPTPALLSAPSPSYVRSTLTSGAKADIPISTLWAMSGRQV